MHFNEFHVRFKGGLRNLWQYLTHPHFKRKKRVFPIPELEVGGILF